MLLFLVYLESLCSVRNCSESGEYCYFLNFLELDGWFVLVFSYMIDLCKLEYWLVSCVWPLCPPGFLDLVGTRPCFVGESGDCTEVCLGSLFQTFVTSLGFYSCFVHG